MRSGSGAGWKALRDFDALCRGCNGTWYPGKGVLCVRTGTRSRDPCSLCLLRKSKGCVCSGSVERCAGMKEPAVGVRRCLPAPVNVRHRLVPWQVGSKSIALCCVSGNDEQQNILVF